MSNQLVARYNDAIHIILDGYVYDCAVGLTDGLSWLRFESRLPFDIGISQDCSVHPKALAREAIRNRCHQDKVVTGVYLKPLRIISVPIWDNNSVVGAISVFLSIALQEETKQIIRTLTNDIVHLSNGLEKLKRDTADMCDCVSRTDSILKIVNDIAANTNILGINAAIEAAHAGDKGAGFSVVANEIRKLSSSSAESIKDIKKILKDVMDRLGTINKDIDRLNSIGVEQAAVTEELEKIVEGL